MIHPKAISQEEVKIANIGTRTPKTEASCRRKVVLRIRIKLSLKTR